MSRVAMICLLSAACSFSGGPGTSDAPGSDAAAATDAMSTADATPLRPFGEPELVEELHTLLGNENRINYDDPSISASGELYLSISDFDNKVASIYRSQRQADRSFASPQIVAELDQDLPTSTLFVSSNGLELYFGRTEDNETDVYVTQRISESDVWDPPMKLAPGPTSSVNVAQAIDALGHVSSDGLRIYFTSNRGVELDLYVATRTATNQPFDNVTKMPLSQDTVLELSPKLTNDELTLYYSHMPVDGTSGFNTYVSTRTSIDQPFLAGNPLSLLSSAGEDDTDFTLNPDGEAEAFLASTRDPGTIRERIYRVVRK